jgi:hypothetical protein
VFCPYAADIKYGCFDDGASVSVLTMIIELGLSRGTFITIEDGICNFCIGLISCLEVVFSVVNTV